MTIVDSHAHLEFAQFDADRAAMLERAQAAGVELLLAIGSGTSPNERLDAAIPFAEEHAWIYSTVGVHPHDAGQARDPHFDQLVKLAQHPRVIAWGEIGLDYYHDFSPPEVQKQVLRRQLHEARQVKLPVIIHCRDAWTDCLEILGQDWASSTLGGIFHCFTGTLSEARRGLEMGFFISFAGNLSYPKNQPIRDVARDLPLDMILMETDSPFLAPQGRRGKRNEPAFVVEVAQTLASVRDLGTDEVAAVTTANFRRLFGLEAGRFESA